MGAGSKPIQFLAAGHLILILFAMCVALAGSATGAEIKTLAKNEATNLSDAQTDSLPIKIPVVDGQDIRFRRLSKSAGLSQTRVASVVQDKLGFIWFGTPTDARGAKVISAIVSTRISKFYERRCGNPAHERLLAL